jgi:hypothetical protein
VTYAEACAIVATIPGGPEYVEECIISGPPFTDEQVSAVRRILLNASDDTARTRGQGQRCAPARTTRR